MKDFLTRLMLIPVRLLGRLPPRLARALVRPVGGLARRALPSRRRIAERHIKLCFPELTGREPKRIVRAHCWFLAEMLADGGMARRRPGERDGRLGSASGRRARAAGRAERH